jgi:hypothetical protein
MTQSEVANGTVSHARPATDTPAAQELARRLNILADPDLAADCVQPMRPVVNRLLLWGAVAAAIWAIMLLLGQ